MPTYDSLFERYPLLRSHSRPVFSGMAATIESVSGELLPSLKALKLATIAHRLDPSKRICQYEVPGGGVCRAMDCEDAHIDWGVIEPGGASHSLDGIAPLSMSLPFFISMLSILGCRRRERAICARRTAGRMAKTGQRPEHRRCACEGPSTTRERGQDGDGS
jgi:hypothetical protein